MRTIVNRKNRRPMCLERLESRYVLDGDGLDDPSLDPLSDPPPDDPAAVTGGDAGDAGGSTDGAGDASNTGDSSDAGGSSNGGGAADSGDTGDTTWSGDGSTGDTSGGSMPTDENGNPIGPIDPGALPGPDATPEQIAALTPEQYEEWCIANNYIDGGYLGYVSYEEPDPSVAIAAAPTPPPSPSAAEELTDLGQIFDQALYHYQAQIANSNDGTNQVLGLGWYGNLSGSGPKCDEVFNGVSDSINKVMADQYSGQTFDDYTFATIVAGGMFAPTGLSDHVYFGIVNKNTGELEYFMDPWRNQMFFSKNPASGDPNWNVQQVNPWTFAPPPPQDPFDPSFDGWWLMQ